MSSQPDENTTTAQVREQTVCTVCDGYVPDGRVIRTDENEPVCETCTPIPRTIYRKVSVGNKSIHTSPACPELVNHDRVEGKSIEAFPPAWRDWCDECSPYRERTIDLAEGEPEHVYITDINERRVLHRTELCPALKRGKSYTKHRNEEVISVTRSYCQSCAPDLHEQYTLTPPETVYIVQTTSGGKKHLHVDDNCGGISREPEKIVEKSIDAYPPAWRVWCSRCAGNLKERAERRGD